VGESIGSLLQGKEDKEERKGGEKKRERERETGY